MKQIIFIEVKSEFFDESEFYAIIDHGNDEFTSMPKSVWDAQQDAQTEPVLPPAPPVEEPVDPAL